MEQHVKDHTSAFRTCRVQRGILAGLLGATADEFSGLSGMLRLGRDWIKASTTTLPVDAGEDGWTLLAKDHDTNANYDVPAPLTNGAGVDVGMLIATEWRGRDLWGMVVLRRPGEGPEEFDARCRKVRLDDMIAAIQRNPEGRLRGPGIRMASAPQ